MNKMQKAVIFISAFIQFALAVLCRWLDRPSPVTFEFIPLHTIAFTAPLLATGLTILIAGYKRFWKENRHVQLFLLLLGMLIPGYIAAFYSVGISVFRFDFRFFIGLFIVAFPFLLYAAFRAFRRKPRHGWIPLVVAGMFLPCYIIILVFLDWQDYFPSSEFVGFMIFAFPFMAVQYGYSMCILWFVQYIFDKLNPAS